MFPRAMSVLLLVWINKRVNSPQISSKNIPQLDVGAQDNNAAVT